MPDVTRTAPPLGRLRLRPRAPVVPPAPSAAPPVEPVAERPATPTPGVARAPVGRINIGRRPAPALTPVSPAPTVPVLDDDIDVVFGEPDPSPEPVQVVAPVVSRVTPPRVRPAPPRFETWPERYAREADERRRAVAEAAERDLAAGILWSGLPPARGPRGVGPHLPVEGGPLFIGPPSLGDWAVPF